MSTGVSDRVLDDLMRSRRSVFPQDYNGEVVEDDLVKRILEYACLAPTHKLTQPWRFVVFKGKGIELLAKFQSELYKNVTSRDGSYKESNYEKLLNKPMLSSHIIAVLMIRDPQRSVPEIEEIGAVFCAIENMYVSAAALGLGCYLSTGGITYMPEAKELFGLAEDDRLIGFFHLGIPKKEYPPVKRKLASDVSKWITADDDLEKM